MALAVTQRPDITRFEPQAGMNSPYPIGLWKGARAIAGDGTGGLLMYTCAPASAAEAAKYLWSLEAIQVYRSNGAAANWVFYQMNTGERYINEAGGAENISFAMEGLLPNVGAAQNNGDTYPANDYWHSMIHQPGNGLTNSYVINLDNQNGITFTFAVWGYVWNSEARRLAGGPRRP